MMNYITGPQPTQADALLYPLTLTAQRSQYIAVTQPYLDVGYSMVVLKQLEQSSAFIFANPFTGTAWLAILGALLATILALILTDGFTRHARLRAIERVHGIRRAKKLHRKERAAEYALEATFMALGAGSTPTSPSWSTRLVFIGWGIAAVILLATYTANLTANLTVSQLATPFKTLDEMARDPEIRFATVVNGSIESYFRTSSDRVARSLVDRMELYPNNADAVAAVRNRTNPVFAAMLDYPVAVWWASQPPCDLALGADTFGPGALVLAFPKGSPLAAPLSASLMRLTDDGTMAELRRQWLSTAVCGGSEGHAGGSDVSENQSSLGIEQIWGVFFLLAILVALGALYALGEVIYYRRFYRGQVEVLPRSPTVLRLRELVTGTPSSLSRSGGLRSGGRSGSGGSGGGGGGGAAGVPAGAVAGTLTDVGYVRDAPIYRDDIKELRRQFRSGDSHLSEGLGPASASASGGGGGGGSARSAEARAAAAAAAATAALGGAAAVGAGARMRSSGGGGARTPSVRFSLGGADEVPGAAAAGAAPPAAAAPSPFAAATGAPNGADRADCFADASSSMDSSGDDGDDGTSSATSDGDGRGGGADSSPSSSYGDPIADHGVVHDVEEGQGAAGNGDQPGVANLLRRLRGNDPRRG
jgi:hypothetical protein